MVKCYHDWNSHIATWESDGRVFKERAKTKPKTPLMELFALDFLHFDGPDPDRTQLRGTVRVIDDGVHTVFSSDSFRTVRLGRFDAFTGGDFSRGDHRPIDGEYDVSIHTDLEDKTHGKLFLNCPSTYRGLQLLGADLNDPGRPHYQNEVLVWNTGQCGYPDYRRTHDTLYRRRLVGPHCALNVLFAVYRDAVAATVQLTLVASRHNFDLDESVEVVAADVCGKVTARNTMLTDPDAFSTLFDRTTGNHASIVLGDLIPLSKPSVVVPAVSSLLLDLDLAFSIKSNHDSYSKLLKTKSLFQVPSSQAFENFVDIVSPDTGGAIAMLKVEVKWLK